MRRRNEHTRVIFMCYHLIYSFQFFASRTHPHYRHPHNFTSLNSTELQHLARPNYAFISRRSLTHYTRLLVNLISGSSDQLSWQFRFTTHFPCTKDNNCETIPWISNEVFQERNFSVSKLRAKRTYFVLLRLLEFRLVIPFIDAADQIESRCVAATKTTTPYPCDPSSTKGKTTHSVSEARNTLRPAATSFIIFSQLEPPGKATTTPTAISNCFANSHESFIKH